MATLICRSIAAPSRQLSGAARHNTRRRMGRAGASGTELAGFQPPDAKRLRRRAAREIYRLATGAPRPAVGLRMLAPHTLPSGRAPYIRHTHRRRPPLPALPLLDDAQLRRRLFVSYLKMMHSAERRHYLSSISLPHDIGHAIGEIFTSGFTMTSPFSSATASYRRSFTMSHISPNFLFMRASHTQ